MNTPFGKIVFVCNIYYTLKQKNLQVPRKILCSRLSDSNFITDIAKHRQTDKNKGCDAEGYLRGKEAVDKLNGKADSIGTTHMIACYISRIGRSVSFGYAMKNAGEDRSEAHTDKKEASH